MPTPSSAPYEPQNNQSATSPTTPYPLWPSSSNPNVTIYQNNFSHSQSPSSGNYFSGNSVQTQYSNPRQDTPRNNHDLLISSQSPYNPPTGYGTPLSQAPYPSGAAASGEGSFYPPPSSQNAYSPPPSYPQSNANDSTVHQEYASNHDSLPTKEGSSQGWEWVEVC
jgi:hypothetical protein